MLKHHLMLCFFAILTSVLLFSRTSATTDIQDVKALKDLYSALNYPPQLTGWNSSNGDPCGEFWRGVSCSGTSVLYVKIPGLGLGGILGLEISNLLSLKELDVSFNSIHGAIPFYLPPNATHINLAFNQFNENIPSSLASMKLLSHLNLSHNSLSGPIGNIFTGLTNLKQLDLSFNSFTGDLPISFSTLTNLTGLFLQNNQFTGSVTYLADLPLSDLNIQNNHFSGSLPKQFDIIPNLSIEGNMFVTGAAHPLPHNNITPINTSTDPNERNAPTTKSNAVKTNPSSPRNKHTHKRLHPGEMACIVGAVAFIAAFASAIVVAHDRRSRKHQLQRLQSSENSFHALPISTEPRESIETLEPRFKDSPIPILRRTPTAHSCRSGRTPKRLSFPTGVRTLMTAKTYTVADLQIATNSFCEDNLLGEGSLGPVYKGFFPNGQTVVVKKFNMVALSRHEEDQFLDAICSISRLRHPNITNLLGYCVEHQLYLVVYEYVGNISLEDALHLCQDTCKTLSWAARTRIALGVARALEYLHSTITPPVVLNNLKAGNIMLDDEFIPHLCDCGLDVLRPLISINFKASELPVGCSGYTAPEFGVPGMDKTKCDVYGFGVMLMELLTGRKPFDSSREREEQSLVKWASTRLHDLETLQAIVDPAIRGSYSFKSLSRFADIITMCIQAEPEFRPPMSDIAESLVRMIQRTSFTKQNLTDRTDPDTKQTPEDRTDLDSADPSFRTTNSCFESSPPVTTACSDPKDDVIPI
ncbi:protein STRUBBELIG-RECEPTOR FAMILY 8-like [Tasmannia lanceolata]|uniref:protein STRUBBELIG-RECEPTOR FAMILY 8-like n=1 Tax=Tasmannia lanceolata TaxID=3420 RepID=UPI004062B637